jgi:hypothetical protein
MCALFRLFPGDNPVDKTQGLCKEKDLHIGYFHKKEGPRILLYIFSIIFNDSSKGNAGFT